ncbi:MAG TPA: aminopeptidase N [Actinocrinis sp.]|jgi:aminopeptidase N
MPTEITRDESRERARLIRVDGYDVELDLTRGGEVFGSDTTVRFHCAQPGGSSFIDLIADRERIRAITLNGAALDPAACFADDRIALSDLAADNTLRVEAELRYVNDSAGLHRAVDPLDGKVYLYTNLAPAEARKVFAHFEQPDLKGAFTITVLAPAGWTVISNQPAPEPEPVAGNPGAARWSFGVTPPLPGYIVNVTAGEYTMLRASHTTPRGQIIPLGVCCRASLAGHLDADEVFEITRSGLDYYTGLFEDDFPFAKYDQAFVPDFSAGAMENAGAVTISEDFLFRSKVTDTMREMRATVILHEMAHMWFGDLVTMRWWGDLWLNESFAEFAGTLSTAEATRHTGAWTTFANSRKAWGYGQDRLPSTHPISDDLKTLSEVISNLDGISYAKGASVIKQLVAYVGREQFFAGVRAYFARHAWSNAELADLLRELERTSGRDLSAWSRAWLESTGPNTLRADFELDDAGAYRSFAVLQEAPDEHPTLRPHRIAIGLYERRDGALRRYHRIEVDVDGPRTPVPELAGVRGADLVLPNDDDLGYALLRFDERSLATLVGSIAEFDESLPRAVCWTNALDMAQQADMAVPDFVRMVVRGMGSERSVSVLQNLHQYTLMVLRTLGDPAWAAEGHGMLAEAAERLLHEAAPGSDHQLAWAQLLGRTAVTKQQLDMLAGLLDGGARIPGLVVDTDLRWSLLQRLASTGCVDDTRIAAELERDPSDAGRRSAIACRAAIPDAAHKEAAWALLTGTAGDSAALNVQGVHEIAHAFRQPEQAELLEPYTERYFEALPALWASHDGFLKHVLAQRLFPAGDTSPRLFLLAEQAIAKHADDAALARIVIEGRDAARRAAKSRALPGG